MSDYDNTNRGVLFKNKNKEPGDNRPDYSGNINVDGVEKQIAAWIKEAKSGTTFFSISVSEPYNKESAPAPKPAAPEQDLPF